MIGFFGKIFSIYFLLFLHEGGLLKTSLYLDRWLGSPKNWKLLVAAAWVIVVESAGPLVSPFSSMGAPLPLVSRLC